MKLSDALIKYETITKEQIEAIVNGEDVDEVAPKDEEEPKTKTTKTKETKSTKEEKESKE